MSNYVDLAAANAYIDINPIVNVRWGNLTDPQKQNYIDYAEKWVDNLDWLGIKQGSSQVEAFPRVDIETEAYEYDYYWNVEFKIIERIEGAEGVVPDEIPIAVNETIIYVVKAKQFDTLVTLQGINVKNFSAGDASFGFEGAKPKFPLPDDAWKQVYWLHRGWWRNRSSAKVSRI